MARGAPSLVAVFVGSLLLCGGCGAPYTLPEDAAIVFEASVPDGSRGSDAGSWPPDGGMLTRPDAGMEDAGTVTCVCETVMPCEVAGCLGETCQRAFAEDGSDCSGDALEICVSGACVPRGCGDGYRQPGPEPIREGCDDGNNSLDDLCSPECVPTSTVLASRALGRDSPSGHGASIAIDGSGAALLVWRAHDSTGYELRGRRFTATGESLDAADAPLVISGRIGVGQPLNPAVTGLAGGGWVVAWDPPDGDVDLTGVVFRIIQRDGAIGARTIATQERYLDQRDPSIAPLEDGFVIAWADGSQLLGLGPTFRIAARTFGPTGAARSSDMIVSSEPRREQRAPSVASSGSTFLVAWEDMSVPIEDGSAIRARRFGASGPIDATDLVIAPARALDVAVTTLATGDFVAAWRDGNRDPYGDIAARRVMASGTALAEPAEPISASPEPFGSMTTDFAPSIAPLTGEHYLVLYARWVSAKGLRLATSAGATVPPELDLLRTAVEEGTAGDGALARSTRGLWAAWSTGSDPNDVGAYRSTMATLLAVE